MKQMKQYIYIYIYIHIYIIYIIYYIHVYIIYILYTIYIYILYTSNYIYYIHIYILYIYKYIYIYIYIYIILYIHFLVNLDSSPFYLAMVQSQCLKMIGRNCGLSNLCHGCRFTCQQSVLNTFPGLLAMFVLRMR